MLANPCVISETSAFTSITNGLDNLIFSTSIWKFLMSLAGKLLPNIDSRKLLLPFLTLLTP